MNRVLVIVTVLAIPVGAAAQGPGGSHQISEVRSKARGHFGPFYVTPRVLLKELGVDSNVFNTAGEQESDFTFTLRPSLDTWVPIARRALIRATVAPDLVWYAEHASERAVNPNVTVRSDVYLSRLTLFGERQYVNARERPNHELDIRTRQLQERNVAGVGLAITPSLAAEITGRLASIRHQAGIEVDGTSLERTLNRDVQSFQLTVRHRLSPLTTLAVRSDRTTHRFPLLPARDADSWRVMPGVEFAPQALIKGTAYVGHRTFTASRPGDLPAFNGLVGDLGLSYTLLGATVFGASYRRDLTYSYSEVQPFFVDNAVGLSVRRALGHRFDVLLSRDRHRYDYRNALTAGRLGPAEAGPYALGPAEGGFHDLALRRDTTWVTSGSVGYRFGRDGRIGFGVWHAQRESTTSGRSYSNLRFGCTIGYGI
jgi:hypothetical protein